MEYEYITKLSLSLNNFTFRLTIYNCQSSSTKLIYDGIVHQHQQDKSYHMIHEGNIHPNSFQTSCIPLQPFDKWNYHNYTAS